MHTRQGVAVPALIQDSASFFDNYEQDALRRATLHRELWKSEPLTPSQMDALQWEVSQ